MNTWHNIRKKNEEKDKKSKGKKKRYEKTTEMESEKREREGEREKDFFSLLSKIYGNRTLGFRWRKRKSRSTNLELRVGTKILEFHQTSIGREFFYLKYF